MDQLIAAYALASTPRGTYIPESIFAPTPDTRPQAVDTSLTSAVSIAPKHRLSAPGSPGAVSTQEDVAQGRATAGPAFSPQEDAAQGRAIADPAFSSAPGKAKPGRALCLAPLQIPNAAPSAVQATPPKVRFSFAAPDGSPGDDSSQDDESQGSTAKSGSSGAKAVSVDAAAGTRSADRPALPLAGAAAKPKRSFKQFLKRALH